VTRTVLCLSLSVLTLALGLWTAGLQSRNFARGLALNDLRERCSMLEAINGDQAAEILARDCALLAPEPSAPAKPAPQNPTRAPDAQSIAKAAARGSQVRGNAP